MNDREITSDFLSLAEAVTTQAQAITTKVQAKTTHANWEVGPRVHGNSITMASRLRQFTRMNPPMFFRSKAGEDPQDVLNEVDII